MIERLWASIIALHRISVSARLVQDLIYGGIQVWDVGPHEPICSMRCIRCSRVDFIHLEPAS